jgi:hypothetical protein
MYKNDPPERLHCFLEIVLHSGYKKPRIFMLISKMQIKRTILAPKHKNLRGPLKNKKKVK